MAYIQNYDSDTLVEWLKLPGTQENICSVIKGKSQSFYYILNGGKLCRPWLHVKRECPLRLSHIENRWRIMKTHNFSYSSERAYGKNRNVVGLPFLK